MGINHFTDEQQENLRENPYIKKVSQLSITYTVAFRELFAREYRNGKTPSQILTECGIDHKVMYKGHKLTKRLERYIGYAKVRIL